MNTNIVNFDNRTRDKALKKRETRTWVLPACKKKRQKKKERKKEKGGLVDIPSQFKGFESVGLYGYRIVYLGVRQGFLTSCRSLCR